MVARVKHHTVLVITPLDRYYRTGALGLVGTSQLPLVQLGPYILHLIYLAIPRADIFQLRKTVEATDGTHAKLSYFCLSWVGDTYLYGKKQ